MRGACLVAVVFLAGGGLLETSSVATAAPPDSGAAGKARDQKAADQKAPRRIQIWWGVRGNLGEAFRSQVARYNDSQQQIVVETRMLDGYQGVFSELKKALGAGDLPDAAVIEIHQIPSFAAENQILPLDRFIKDDPKFQSEDLLPGILTNLRYGERLYALPMNRSTPILYYNKSQFADAGLDPNKPPETWQQFREMARALTSEDGNRYGFAASPSAWIFESMVWSAAGELMNGKKTAFAEPGAKSLQLWADMVHRDKSARCDVNPSSEFIGGRAAMFIESTALLQGLDTNSTFEVGTAFLPRWEGAKNAVPTGGGAAVIPAAIPAERQAAAWAFLTWFTSTAQTAEWSRLTGYIPVRQSACTLLRKEGFYRELPAFETAIRQMKFAREAPLLPQWPAAWGIIGEAMNTVIRDNQPALAALKTAEDRVNALVNPQGEPKPK